MSNERERLREYLDQLLKKVGTARELGRRLGVAHTTVQAWYDCATDPQIVNLRKLANLGGLTLDELDHYLVTGKLPDRGSLVEQTVLLINRLKPEELREVQYALTERLLKLIS